ncbi:hypothetical protein HRbin34_00552 [bacterium HR34]|nr:hypothetical protein HRbin34_00552 [bacterium HR34]
MILRVAKIFTFVLLFLFFVSPNAIAYEIVNYSNMDVRNDIVLSPPRWEVEASPGDETVKVITVANRTGKTQNFKVEVEDFTGTYNLEDPIKFYGEGTSPFSAKGWIKPEVDKFTLKHGDEIRFKVFVRVPENAEPGGKYGAVFVATIPQKSENVDTISIVSRIGSLFLIKVKGDVLEKGYLTDFSSDKSIYFTNNPIKFSFVFTNKGNVHLKPKGFIEIYNLIGSKVDVVNVDDYFVLPDSARKREVFWTPKLAFGKYTANLILEHQEGDNTVTETKKISFFVIPFNILAIIGGVLILIYILWRFVFSKIQITFKK